MSFFFPSQPESYCPRPFVRGPSGRSFFLNPFPENGTAIILIVFLQHIPFFLFPFLIFDSPLIAPPLSFRPPPPSTEGLSQVPSRRNNFLSVVLCSPLHHLRVVPIRDSTHLELNAFFFSVRSLPLSTFPSFKIFPFLDCFAVLPDSIRLPFFFSESVSQFSLDPTRGNRPTPCPFSFFSPAPSLFTPYPIPSSHKGEQEFPTGLLNMYRFPSEAFFLLSIAPRTRDAAYPSGGIPSSVLSAPRVFPSLPSD